MNKLKNLKSLSDHLKEHLAENQEDQIFEFEKLDEDAVVDYDVVTDEEVPDEIMKAIKDMVNPEKMEKTDFGVIKVKAKKSDKKGLESIEGVEEVSPIDPKGKEKAEKFNKEIESKFAGKLK